MIKRLLLAVSLSLVAIFGGYAYLASAQFDPISPCEQELSSLNSGIMWSGETPEFGGLPGTHYDYWVPLNQVIQAPDASHTYTLKINFVPVQPDGSGGFYDVERLTIWVEYTGDGGMTWNWHAIRHYTPVPTNGVDIWEELPPYWAYRTVRFQVYSTAAHPWYVNLKSMYLDQANCATVPPPTPTTTGWPMTSTVTATPGTPTATPTTPAAGCAVGYNFDTGLQGWEVSGFSLPPLDFSTGAATNNYFYWYDYGPSYYGALRGYESPAFDYHFARLDVSQLSSDWASQVGRVLTGTSFSHLQARARYGHSYTTMSLRWDNSGGFNGVSYPTNGWGVWGAYSAEGLMDSGTSEIIAQGYMNYAGAAQYYFQDIEFYMNSADCATLPFAGGTATPEPTATATATPNFDATATAIYGGATATAAAQATATATYGPMATATSAAQATATYNSHPAATATAAALQTEVAKMSGTATAAAGTAQAEMTATGQAQATSTAQGTPAPTSTPGPYVTPGVGSVPEGSLTGGAGWEGGLCEVQNFITTEQECLNGPQPPFEDASWYSWVSSWGNHLFCKSAIWFEPIGWINDLTKVPVYTGSYVACNVGRVSDNFGGLNESISGAFTQQYDMLSDLASDSPSSLAFGEGSSVDTSGVPSLGCEIPTMIAAFRTFITGSEYIQPLWTILMALLAFSLVSGAVRMVITMRYEPPYVPVSAPVKPDTVEGDTPFSRLWG